MSTIEEVMNFYNTLVNLVNKGSSLTKALKSLNKDFTALRRIKELCELNIVRAEKFHEVIY